MATITVHTNLGIKGYKTLELTEHAFSTDGISSRALTALSGMKAIGDILFNPFTPANLDGKMHSLDVKVAGAGMTVRARKNYLARAVR